MTAQAPLIAHVVYRLAVGGLENGLVNLVNRLRRDAWRHVIVSLTDIDPAFARRIDDRRIELVALDKPPGHAWALYPRLVRLFRSLGPAIVHTRNLAALEVTPAAWAAGVPVRLHGEHGRDAEDPDGGNVRRRRIRRLYRPFVTHYIALSPDLAAYLRDAIGVQGGRIDQIYNGVDCRTFTPAGVRGPIAGSPFNDAGCRIVGTVGRLDPVKNHVGLVHAFARMLREHPRLADALRLVIVGEGSERAAVEAALTAAGISQLAWLAGERQDIADVLRGFDVFVLPSIGEGVSNTVLEAMATGLPVVATNVGANADLVSDGVTGAIVPPGDSALGEAVARYAENAALARAHGAAGRTRVEQQFSIERMVDRYHQLYFALAAASASRRARGGLRSRHAPY